MYYLIKLRHSGIKSEGYSEDRSISAAGRWSLGSSTKDSWQKGKCKQVHDDEALMQLPKNAETEKNQPVPRKRIESNQMDRRLWKEEKERNTK